MHCGTCTCEASGELRRAHDMTDLVKDLAYKIAFDLSKGKQPKARKWNRFKYFTKLLDKCYAYFPKAKDDNSTTQDKKQLKARTWTGFKYFTGALDKYYLYLLTNRIEDLYEAYDICIDALKSEPGYSTLFGLCYNIGIELFEIEDYEKAEIMFLSSIKIKKHAGAYCGLAACRRYVWHLNEAYLDALDAKSLDTELALPHVIIGSIYLDAGSYATKLYDKAIENYNIATKNDPNFPYPVFGIGLVHFKREEFDLAKDYFGKVDELIGDEKYEVLRLSSRLALATCHKQTNEIEKYFEDVREIRWKISRESVFNRAAFEAIVGNEDESLRLLGQALRKKFATATDVRYDPDFRGLRNNIKFMRLLDLNKEDSEIIRGIRDFILGENASIKASFESTIGNYEVAVKLLKEALDNKEISMEEIEEDSHFEGLRTHPNYKDGLPKL